MAFSGSNTPFSFGAPATTTQGGGLTFGAPAATTQATTGFSFGTTPTTSTALNFGLGSGINAAKPAFSFGAPAATSTAAFTFGSPSTATQAGGLSFGQPTASAPTTQATSGFSFGTTPSLAAPTATTNAAPLSFGAPAAVPSLAPASSTPSGGLSFGAPASTAPAGGLSFGAPASTAPAGGLSFGAPASTAPAGGLSFGAPASTAPAGGLSFGAPAPSTPAGGLSFGAPVTTTAAGGLSFGTPASTTPAGGLSFGAPVTSAPAGTNFSFGATPAATTSTGLNFGLGSNLNAANTTSAAKPTFSFGAQTTASTLPTFGASSATTTPSLFGTPTTSISAGGFGAKPGGLTFPATTTTAATGLSFSFSSPATSVAANTGLGGKTTGSLTVATTTAATTFKGLGGVDPSQISSGTSTTVGQSDKIAVKDHLIPNELMQTVEQFKNFVKTQKSISSEVARASVKPMDKIAENTDAMRSLLSNLATSLQKNKAAADKIKAETMKCFQNCEMAQRTQDTPSGLQNQNIAPLDFFVNLVSSFDHDLNVLKLEIENAERHVKSLTSCSELSPHELSQTLRKLHDSFVALAGRLQGVHTAVQTLKNQHLSLRRMYLKDSTNIFEKKSIGMKKADNVISGTMFSPGPTPFSAMGNLNNLVTLSALGITKCAYTPVTPATLSTWNNPSGFSVPSLISNTSMINQSTSTLSGGVFAANTSSFQLQKPPLGNKRGKR